MNNENTRSAARLRRSNVAARLQIREEWSVLKGTTDNHKPPKKITKRNPNIRRKFQYKIGKENDPKNSNNNDCSEVLRGCVALVDLGLKNSQRALALRATLKALGATVVPEWCPIATHVVWSEGGSRAVRARARALAAHVVSPMWVEACAQSKEHSAERLFPIATRTSDPPSPRTMQQIMKKMEMENISIANLLQDSEDGNKEKTDLRLRLSSSTDSTQDTTQTRELRVNTAPRRAQPVTLATPHCMKSKRRLFTHKEQLLKGVDNSDDTDSDLRPSGPKKMQLTPTQRERRNLTLAKRIALKLAAAPAHKKTEYVNSGVPRIVLTCMSRDDRHAAYDAIRQLNGIVQTRVNKRTTHVIMGSCRRSGDQTTHRNVNISGVTSNINRSPERSMTVDDNENRFENSIRTLQCKEIKVRTLNALLGAARGCRILNMQWVEDSVAAGKWLHYNGYEIPHLKNISMKARIERKVLNLEHAEHAYNVFNGLRVRVSPNTVQRHAAIKLLKLCGAVVIEQHVCDTQNDESFDITLGTGVGEVDSKWVFDSVAAARLRTMKKYIN